MKSNKSERIYFFGSFAFFKFGNTAYAASGSQVQLEIIKSIKKAYSNSLITSFIVEPNKTWPFANFFINKNVSSDFYFFSYINIKYIREIQIIFKKFKQIFLNTPNYIFVYNITFLESIFYSLLKIFFKFRIILFIQDVNENNFLQYFSNKITYKLVSNFDILIPITNSIINDFNLPPKKCILFSGGCTDIAYKMQQICLKNTINLQPIAVFAGRLEKYNGIDKLVDYWVKNNIQYELHIYGSGSCLKDLEISILLNSNIKYFGLVSDIDVFNIQQYSAVNICLRYSIDMNQNYFFPSKIFNLLSAPGSVLINNFNNIPLDMFKYCMILDDDFSNLSQILDSTNDFNLNNYKKRIDWVNEYANWEELLMKIKIVLT